MVAKAKPCLVSCSVLKEELERLVKQGDSDTDLIFVSKYIHADYSVLEQNLRKVAEKSLSCSSGTLVIVYSELCLGPNYEMKKLTEEYRAVKVDAVNCVDCVLGGKGKVLEVDPNHDLLFLCPGMINFFRYFKEKVQQENIGDEAFNKLFSGPGGIRLLDTFAQSESNIGEIEKLHEGPEVLETKAIGLDKIKQFLLEVIEEKIQKN